MIGTSQSDDVKQHYHYIVVKTNGAISSGTNVGAYNGETNNGNYQSSGVVGGATETRPRNIALMAVIKY